MAKWSLLTSEWVSVGGGVTHGPITAHLRSSHPHNLIWDLPIFLNKPEAQGGATEHAHLYTQSTDYTKARLKLGEVKAQTGRWL